VGSFHLNGMPPDINRVFPAELLDHMGYQFTGMAGMGGGTDAGCEQNRAGLLRGHVDPTGTPLVTGKIAFTVGAQAAEIAKREVKWFIPIEQREVP